MSKSKRFVPTWNMHRTLHYFAITDNKEKIMYCVQQCYNDVEKVVDLLNGLYNENEELRDKVKQLEEGG